MSILERVLKSKQYIIDLLCETSTWRGIIFFASFLLNKYVGQIDDATAASISVAASYMVGILFKDDFLKKKEEGKDV